jgi:hypothetical protein
MRASQTQVIGGIAFALTLHATPVLAQRAGENVVTASTTAFGASVGLERTGLYVDEDVRGFRADSIPSASYPQLLK